MTREQKNHAFSQPMHDLVNRDYENRMNCLVISHNISKEINRTTCISGNDQDRLYESFKYERFSQNIIPESSVFMMKRELAHANSDKISEFIIKTTSKTILDNRIKARFNKAIDTLKKDTEDLKRNNLDEEINIQRAVEAYGLNKIEKDEYRLRREIAQNQVSTCGTEITTIETNISILKKDRSTINKN